MFFFALSRDFELNYLQIKNLVRKSKVILNNSNRPNEIVQIIVLFAIYSVKDI